MVPVKEAIQSGVWFLFSSNDDAFKFRLRVLSFEKIDLALVDNPEKIENHYVGAEWWLMEIEAINWNKKQIDGDDLLTKILLVDQEGFEFNVFQDDYLSGDSEFGRQFGLDRFQSYSELSPKIKAVGAISFQLPDDGRATYSLAMKDGTVTEV